MYTAVINIKTEPKLKADAQKVVREMGVSLSSFINHCLKQLVETKSFLFNAKSEEKPSDFLIKAIKQAELERKRGDYLSFKDPDKAIAYLDKLINHEKKRAAS